MPVMPIVHTVAADMSLPETPWLVQARANPPELACRAPGARGPQCHAPTFKRCVAATTATGISSLIQLYKLAQAETPATLNFIALFSELWVATPVDPWVRARGC